MVGAAAVPPGRPQGGPERPLPLRQRQEGQAVLRHRTPHLSETARGAMGPRMPARARAGTPGDDPRDRSGPYVVLLPREDADGELDDRTRRELRLLGRVSRLPLPFRVPAVVGAYPESGHMALVRRFVPGIELDLRAGRQPGVRPW